MVVAALGGCDDRAVTDPTPEAPEALDARIDARRALLDRVPDGLKPMMDPVALTRTRGKPDVAGAGFATHGFQPPFVLLVVNGDGSGPSRVRSAIVELNGSPVLTPGDFDGRRRSEPGGPEELAVAVDLAPENILGLRVAGRPGSFLRAWVEGRPVWPARVATRTGGEAVTKEIGPSGGQIVAHDPDGTRLTLTVPEKALAENVRISLTPLATVDGFGYGVALLGGARLEPAGLTFRVPVTLEIRLPEAPSAPPVGFASRAGGEGFHLEFSSVDGPSVRLRRVRFSDVGAATGLEGACETADLSGASAEEKAKHRINCILAGAVAEDRELTADEETGIVEAFEGWMGAIITTLASAQECWTTRGCPDPLAATQTAIDGFLAWPVAVDVGGGFLTGSSDRLLDLEALGRSEVGALLTVGMETTLAVCESEEDPGALADAGRHLVALQVWVGVLGWAELDPLVLPLDHLLGVCGTLTVEPSSVVLHEGETATLTAVLVDGAGEEQVDPPFTWTSADPLVATVEDGTVRALAPGRTTVTVEVYGKTAPVDVTVQPSTGVVRGRVWLDDGDETWEEGVDEPVVIEILVAESKRSTTTAADGTYRFDDLAPGDYTIKLGLEPVGVRSWAWREFRVTVHEGAESTANFIGVRVRPGLVSHWPAEGDGEDVAGLNDGSSPPGFLAPRYVPGVSGQAFGFDERRTVLGGFTAHGLEGVRAITLEAWVRVDEPAAPDGVQRFVSLMPGTAVLREETWDDGRRFLHFYVAVGEAVEPLDLLELWADPLPTGCFQHVVGTYDGQQMRLYVNGELVASREASGELVPVQGFHFSSPDEPLRGALDEVKVHSRALTAAEVAQSYLANAPATSSCAPICTVEEFRDLGTFGWPQASAIDVAETGAMTVWAHVGDGTRAEILYRHPDGSAEVVPCGSRMNDHGVVAGSYEVHGVDPETGEPTVRSRACLWGPGTGLRDVTPPGALEASGWDVNLAGEVAGALWVEGTVGVVHAVWNASGIVRPLTGLPHRINNTGTALVLDRLEVPGGGVVPIELTDGTRLRGVDLNDFDAVAASYGSALIWERGDVTFLGALPRVLGCGGGSSRAQGLNDNGQVVGYSGAGCGATHAFLWSEGAGMLNLHPVGYAMSMAAEISDAGVVVGDVWNHAGVRSAAMWRTSCTSR